MGDRALYISMILHRPFVSIHLAFSVSSRHAPCNASKTSIRETYVFPGCHDTMHHYGCGWWMDGWSCSGAVMDDGTWPAVSSAVLRATWVVGKLCGGEVDSDGWPFAWCQRRRVFESWRMTVQPRHTQQKSLNAKCFQTALQNFASSSSWQNFLGRRRFCSHVVCYKTQVLLCF